MLHMLQWLYTYVAKVHLQCFICFSDVCCKHVYLNVGYVFTHMLQVFYLDVVYVLQRFSSVFANILNACFKCFICLFYMLQVLHLNVSKSRLGVAHGIRVGSWRGHVRPMWDVGAGPCVVKENGLHPQAFGRLGGVKKTIFGGYTFL
jgi:hypothetical protein